MDRKEFWGPPEPLDNAIQDAMRQLNAAAEKLSWLSATCMYQGHDVDETALQALEASERAALRTRTVVREYQRCFTVENEEGLLTMSAKVQGISVTTEDEVPKITIMGVLPSRWRRYREYIGEPLRLEIVKYIEETGWEKPLAEKTTLVVCHRYPNNLANTMIRDHDNVELKGIIDDVALLFLVDDSMAFCDRLFIAKPSDSYSTELFLVPSAKLPEWLKKHYSA